MIYKYINFVFRISKVYAPVNPPCLCFLAVFKAFPLLPPEPEDIWGLYLVKKIIQVCSTSTPTLFLRFWRPTPLLPPLFLLLAKRTPPLFLSILRVSCQSLVVIYVVLDAKKAYQLCFLIRKAERHFSSSFLSSTLVFQYKGILHQAGEEPRSYWGIQEHLVSRCGLRIKLILLGVEARRRKA